MIILLASSLVFTHLFIKRNDDGPGYKPAPSWGNAGDSEPSSEIVTTHIFGTKKKPGKQSCLMLGLRLF